MKWYWWLIIVIIILVIISYLIYKNKPDGKKIIIDGLNGQFGTVLQESIPSDYQKCVDNLKKLPENSPCTNCVPDGSGMANYVGIIKNGICQQNRI